MAETLTGANNSTTYRESIVDVATYPTVIRRAGSGRPLLFLHGAFFPTTWSPLHDLLAEHAEVIAPLHPGYSEGGPPDWLRGFDDLVLHYHDLTDALGVTRFDLVGYDLGGWVAALFARFYPERVRSLTLIAASGLLVPNAPMLEFLAANPARVSDALFNGEPLPGYAPPGPSDIDRFVDGYGQNGVTARLIWERRYDPRFDRRAPRIMMPSLVIAASEDRIVPAAHARRWADLLGDSRLTMLDQCGHALPVQSAAQVASTIHSFLAEVPS